MSVQKGEPSALDGEFLHTLDFLKKKTADYEFPMMTWGIDPHLSQFNLPVT